MREIKVTSTNDDVIRETHRIAEQLTETYPLISSNGELGEPHLAGTRFAVANVLSAVTAHNSLDEVISEYDQAYTKEQLTQAIHFSRDFLNAFFRYADTF